MLKFTFELNGHIVHTITVPLGKGTGGEAFEIAAHDYRSKVDPNWVPGQGGVSVTIKGI